VFSTCGALNGWILMQWGDTHLAELPEMVHPFTLLDGYLSEPMLLVRDSNDTLSCLSGFLSI
jgi:hypothetical protein